MDVTFPIFQSSGISSDCHDLSKMSEASQWQEPAFLVLLDASCLVPFPQVLPDIIFYHRYCFTPTDSASRFLGGTWEALRQALAVKTEAKKVIEYLGLDDQPAFLGPFALQGCQPRNPVKQIPKQAKICSQVQAFSSPICPIFFSQDLKLIFMVAVTSVTLVLHVCDQFFLVCETSPEEHVP